MAGLLDATGDDTFFPDGVPPSLYLGATTAEDAPPPAADAPPVTPPAKDVAPATPAADEPSFFQRLAHGIGQAGMVLAGGDPELANLTPAQQHSVGTRALLNFGLSMLANSGPTTQPRNFGQILAAGLESAGKVPTTYEELLNQRDTQRANTALKYGALDIQRMSAAARLKQLQIILQQIQGGKNAAEGALSQIGQPGAKTGEGAAPTPLTPFVAANLPEGVTPEEDQAVRTVIGEAGGESPAGQQAVAATIKNRAKAGGQSVTDVIFTPNAYEPWNNPETRKKLEAIDPASEQYQRILTTAVRPIMSGEAADPTGGATHFVNPALQKQLGREMPSWATGSRTTIGNHDFYYPGYRAPGGGGPAPGRVQVAAVTPNSATDGTTAAPPPTSAVLTAPGSQGATTPPAAGTPGQGAAAPPPAALPSALVTPPELPKMDAPGLASVQASRNDLDASHAGRLRALAESPNIHTAQQVSDEQKDYETQKLALDNKARDIQTTFDDKRRADAIAYQTKLAEEARAEATRRREADYKFQQDQQAAAAQHQRELAKDATAAVVSNNHERVKTYNAAGTESQTLKNGIEQLELILPSVGPADVVAQMDPRVRDTLRSLGIGSEDQYQKWTAQDVLTQLANRTSLSAKPAGISRVTNMDVGLITGAMPRLGQSPQAREIGLAMMKTQAQIAIDEARAANKSFNTNPAGASLDDDVSNATGKDSRIPSPPKLLAPDVMKRGAAPAEIDAAKAADEKSLQDYLGNIPLGTVFRTYGAQTVNGKPQRVLTWGYRRPDGSVVINPLGAR